MGHRTLVAYDRAGYDLHYAHWGVDPDEITPRTPFGGQLLDDRDPAVDPNPIATGLTFPGVCSHVDPVEHEALFVVDTDFAVLTYLVFALWREEGGDPDDGSSDHVEGSQTEDAGGSRRVTVALVGYDDEMDAAYLRGWRAGARAVRDVTGQDDEAVVRALRWLDRARGTLWLAGD